MLSFFLWLLPGVSLIPDGDLLLAAVFGGILSGLGFGLILIGQATTGGTDILAALLHIPFPQYSIPSESQPTILCMYDLVYRIFMNRMCFYQISFIIAYLIWQI